MNSGNCVNRIRMSQHRKKSMIPQVSQDRLTKLVYCIILGAKLIAAFVWETAWFIVTIE